MIKNNNNKRGIVCVCAGEREKDELQIDRSFDQIQDRVFVFFFKALLIKYITYVKKISKQAP